jgi:hypothetical protein
MGPGVGCGVCEGLFVVHSSQKMMGSLVAIGGSTIDKGQVPIGTGSCGARHPIGEGFNALVRFASLFEATG